MAAYPQHFAGALIFVLEDDVATGKACREYIAARFSENVRYFDTFEAMAAAPDLDQVDLFIVDIKLGDGLSGFDVPSQLPLRCRFAAFLFMSGFAVAQDEFDRAASLPYFDFIAKPFTMPYLIHRCKLLLSARLKMPPGLDERLLDLWAGTPYIALVLDRTYRIRLANYQLASLLEEKNAAALVGRYWEDYLPQKIVTVYKDIYATILSGDLSEFGEYTGDIQSTDGTLHRVKWFHSPFAGGDESNGVMILAVGMPYRFKLTIADSLRQSWRESILKHRAAIRSIKRMPFDSEAAATCDLNGGK
jgi:CheY-like chemotaxis protein